MKKDNQKIFRLPVQGKAVLRRGSTAYFQEEMATYFSHKDANRDINSIEMTNQASCHQTNQAFGINAYCGGTIANSLFHY
ncbi:MAG: hypothetical protein ACRBFS_17095 [Aureispira sp.]